MQEVTVDKVWQVAACLPAMALENKMDDDAKKVDDTESETSTEIAASWNTAQEDLLSAIADRSNCYRWMHAKCQTVYDRYNFWLTIPSISIGTVAGSATIGLPGITGDPNTTRLLTIMMGLMTLSASVFTSINQYMRSAQFAESHRMAAVAHGKVHRLISAELALRRDQRMNASEFLKSVRSEQDRLQDTSPIILDSVIKLFNKEFETRSDLEKPEVAGDLDHVQVNRSSKLGKPVVTPLDEGTNRVSLMLDRRNVSGDSASQKYTRGVSKQDVLLVLPQEVTP